MALNDITVLQEQADGSFAETVLPVNIGPLSLLQNYNVAYSNSGYAPGITTTSTPSDFGFYPVGGFTLTVNPFDLFGAGSYAIRASIRKTGAFGDGIHVLIRRVIVDSTEIGIPGLLDWGSGLAEIGEATSSGLTTTDAWEFYRVYLAAYNGGNGATAQDLSLTLIRG
jgi:hypothetical protein